MHCRLLLVFATCTILSASPGAAQDDAAAVPDPGLAAALALEQTFAGIAERTFDSVVTITAYERDPETASEERRNANWVLDRLSNDYPGYRKIRVTSGVVVNERRHVIACRHGILADDGSPCDLVSVETADRQHTICEVLGSEPTLNFCVLELAAFDAGAPPRCKPAKLGDSTKMRAGTWAIGAGDPDGPQRFFGVGTFTSVPDRECYQEQLTATYLQAAMTVHPEAYGGPLLDVRGEVLGILCPRFAPGTLEPLPQQGIVFALPIHIVSNLHAAVVAQPSHRSPWLGVAVTSRPELIRDRGPDAFRQLAKPRHGILIENVFDPSPAHAGGIGPGDWLVQIDADPIRTPLEFQKCLYLAGLGREVTLHVWRDGVERAVKLTIEPRPADASFR